MNIFRFIYSSMTVNSIFLGCGQSKDLKTSSGAFWRPNYYSINQESNQTTQIIVTCSPNFDGKWHLRVCDTADVSPTSSFVKHLALIRGADSAGIYFFFRLCFFFFFFFLLDRSPASAGFSHLSRALSVKKQLQVQTAPSNWLRKVWNTASRELWSV